MSEDLTIEDVPEHVRDKLAAQAAERGQSLEAFLLDELTRTVSQPWINPLTGELEEGLRTEGQREPGVDAP